MKKQQEEKRAKAAEAALKRQQQQLAKKQMKKTIAPTRIGQRRSGRHAKTNDAVAVEQQLEPSAG